MILLEGEAKEIDKSSQQNEGYRQGALTTSSVSKQYVVYRPLFYEMKKSFPKRVSYPTILLIILLFLTPECHIRR